MEGRHRIGFVAFSPSLLFLRLVKLTLSRPSLSQPLPSSSPSFSRFLSFGPSPTLLPTSLPPRRRLTKSSATLSTRTSRGSPTLLFDRTFSTLFWFTRSSRFVPFLVAVLTLQTSNVELIRLPFSTLAGSRPRPPLVLLVSIGSRSQGSSRGSFIYCSTSSFYKLMANSLPCSISQKDLLEYDPKNDPARHEEMLLSESKSQVGGSTIGGDGDSTFEVPPYPGHLQRNFSNQSSAYGEERGAYNEHQESTADLVNSAAPPGQAAPPNGWYGQQQRQDVSPCFLSSLVASASPSLTPLSRPPSFPSLSTELRRLLRGPQFSRNSSQQPSSHQLSFKLGPQPRSGILRDEPSPSYLARSVRGSQESNGLRSRPEG